MNSIMTKIKVLAVDDNRTNLHILQVFLKKLGHDVVLAENGEEAVRKFESESPDLVLLDIMMPVMDGFEAARRIKAMTRDRWTQVIFLSALNRDENLVEGLDAGADDYLTKPINFVVLEAKLRSMQRSLALQQQSIESLRRVQTISDNVLDAIITSDEADGDEQNNGEERRENRVVHSRRSEGSLDSHRKSKLYMRDTEGLRRPSRWREARKLTIKRQRAADAARIHHWGDATPIKITCQRRVRLPPFLP